MNKKIVIVAALLMVVCVGGAFAWGIGVQAGGGYPNPGNVAVTFKLDQLPLVFASNFYIGNSFYVGITGDYWFLNDTLVGPLNWYIGGGLGLGFGGFDDNFALNMAARLPIGLNMFLVDNFIEPYFQVVPGLGLNFLPSFGAGFVFDANLGIRFWF